MALPITTRRSQGLGEHHQKILAGEGNWNCIKKVLGGTIEMEVGTVAFLERKLWKLLNLVGIPATQRCTDKKDLERLVGNLCFMHLPVPGAVAHLYHIQHALAQGGGGGGELGLAVSSLSSRNHRLAGPSSANGIPSHAPIQDRPSQTHPYGVLQRFGPRCRGHVA